MSDPQSKPHRKRVRHIEVPRQARLLTFSCYKRLPLLLSEPRRSILGEALERATRSHGMFLLAFVFMPEHVHLVVLPWHKPPDMAAFLFALKRPASYRIREAMEDAGDPELGDLMVPERPGKTSFRFWQEGPGHDRNLTDSAAIVNSIRYVHENPARRGLVADSTEWKWSSARQYAAAETFPDVPAVTRWSPKFVNDLLKAEWQAKNPKPTGGQAASGT